MYLFGGIILAVHYCLVFLLCLFGLHRLSIVARWRKHRHHQPEPNSLFTQLPIVTVQIPVFNERFVAERIINCVAQIEYPSDKLEIQVVDDSTDDTKDFIAKSVAEHKANGLNIHHVHRSDRQGFKAGALKDAMEVANGEFIAIFDADFLPKHDFLINTIHHFTDPKLGMIQTRWDHLNRDSNLLTRTQAMMLDSHFALEQQVRYSTDCLFNFNGTAGIWRKETIISSGNWSADTLTEDLDLSYRAQMQGWQLLYLNDETCPAELPSNMKAFKSQQHRWAKGGTQVMLKMLGQVWKAPFSLKKKIESTFHLSNNLAYLIMLVDTVFFLPLSLVIRHFIEDSALIWIDIPFLTLSSGGHLVYLYYGQVALNHSNLSAFLKLPSLMLLGIQLSFNNARAGLEALLGSESDFIRTPKSGEITKDNYNKVTKIKKDYKAIVPTTYNGEFVVAIIYLFVLIWAAVNNHWFTIPFSLILILGFSGAAFGQLNWLFSRR